MEVRMMVSSKSPTMDKNSVSDRCPAKVRQRAEVRHIGLKSGDERRFDIGSVEFCTSSSFFDAVRVRSFDDIPFLLERKLRHFMIGSNNKSSLAVKTVHFAVFLRCCSTSASSPFVNVRLRSSKAFPSCWIGSYDILIGSTDGSSLAAKVTFSPFRTLLRPNPVNPLNQRISEFRDLPRKGAIWLDIRLKSGITLSTVCLLSGLCPNHGCCHRTDRLKSGITLSTVYLVLSQFYLHETLDETGALAVK
ncbi:hypothetical protein KFK09_009745 [Dendrobium nobile]|uniref:Uncharacterized protein n=1 Tax=Dendrobium nobile TaxID=94219 RepID=A0A8T3BKV4_DENNO|nr:hypothetical protein KFK09_009745 [Dendrobium nobile]